MVDKEESVSFKCSKDEKNKWFDFVNKVKKDGKEVSDVLLRLTDNYLRGVK